jgi:hypothetical protein
MRLLCCFFVMAGLSVGVAVGAPSSKVNVTPGKWANEVELRGPAGDVVQIRNGRTYVNGKDLLAGQLTAAQLRELENASVDCVTEDEIPTVAEYVEHMAQAAGEPDNALKNLRIIEATPRIARFQYDFISKFMSEEPYTGVALCAAKFESTQIDVQCDITWKTPPHTGKKSKMQFRDKRLGTC